MLMDAPTRIPGAQSQRTTTRTRGAPGCARDGLTQAQQRKELDFQTALEMRAMTSVMKKKRGPRGPYRIKPWQERFWRYVVPGEKAECWEWSGSRDQHGYGRIQRGHRDGGIIKAHRASWELHNGEIPDGLCVCHKCDNPPCVNPAHLFLGTMATNSRDSVQKGRNAPWRSPRKLTDQQIREMREFMAAGATCEQAAARFGVSDTYTAAVAIGQRRLEAGGPILPRRQTWRRKAA